MAVIGNMEAQDFAQFVANQQGSAQDSGDAPGDWAEIRDLWLKDLDGLYSQVIEFLEEFVAAGSIHYGFTDVTLTEENIGIYVARRMNIKIGRRQEVFLDPVGTLLVGCRGRVDVVGSAGRAQLVLVDENAKSAADLITVKIGVLPSPPAAQRPISWTWKIVSRDIRRSFVKLDKDSFFELLMEIAGA